MSALAARGISTYRQTEAQSRTPLELVVMLYDGALRYALDARHAIEQRDIARRGHCISRALAVLSELQSTLDIERGGDIAASLDVLYTYVRDRLVDASVTQDARPVDDAVRVLRTLREGWMGVSARVAQSAAR